MAVTAPLTAPAVAVGGAEEIQCGNKAKRLANNVSIWQSFPAPTFSAAVGLEAVPQDIVSYAVDPDNSKKLAVTNGNSVYVSHDGGCAWRLGVRLDRVPSDPRRTPSGQFTTIKSVHIAKGGAVFALAEELETGSTVGRPHVLRSPRGDIGTWDMADSGLPPLGKPLLLRGHRRNSNVLYLTFANAREESSTCVPTPLTPCDPNQQGQRLGLMYRSVDNGKTWSSRTSPNDLNGVAAIKHFSIDDDDLAGNKVWVVANGLLRVSTDGGQTFAAPQGLDPKLQADFRFTAVESLANTKASAQLALVAFSDEKEMLRLEGGKWIRSIVPFPSVESVTQRPEGDIGVATNAGTGRGSQAYVWRIFPTDFRDFTEGSGLGGQQFKLTFGWEPIQPMASLPVNAEIDSGGGTNGRDGAYYVRSKRQVFRFINSVARLPEKGAVGVDLDPLAPPTGRITPSNLTLNLKPGQSQPVKYTLTLPPSPTPIDVFLIVDNSASMLETINSLKRDLGQVARSLRSSGVDVAMGVGEINVEPSKKNNLPVDDPRTKNIDESKPRPVYQRLREIGPVDGELFEKLGDINGDAGVGKEAQVEALYQAVTGDGLSFENLGWLTGYQVEEGQDARFRDEVSAIKVIVHATDEPFTTDLTNGHTFEQAVAALRTSNVKQIGLSQGVDEAARDLARMAEATGALAPAGGTDCDGDGRITYVDVPAGQPLVCGQSSGLDTTLVNLIRSLRDRQVIDLQTRATPAMASVSADSFVIDAKDETTRTFTVTYTCKGLEPGMYVNDLSASLRGLLIARASATVNCGDAAGVPPPNPPLPVEPPANPPPPQPQPLVPAPVPVNPVLQPQPQVQPQTQVNPQAGMADQEEQQLQVATALNDLASREEDQLAMTGLAYHDNPAVVLAIGMALTSAAGAGVAIRRRTRTATAKAFVRR